MTSTQLQIRAKETKKQQEMEKNLNREIPLGQIRAVEGEERTVELSFSSEEPYCRWWGMEILDHSPECMDLQRLNSIGCVLFNHNRDKVIAKIVKAWCENNRGYAQIKFDDDEASDTIFKKVQGGTLKGVSVGYLVDVWETVAANKKSSDGRFEGPCDIAKKWTPFEISIVSIPADPTVGVGREMEGIGKADERTLDYFYRQLRINQNQLGR